MPNIFSLIWQRDQPICGAPVIVALFATLTGMHLGCGESGSRIPPSMSHIVDAQRALESGNQSEAMAALAASLEEEPNVWAYYQRAKLYLDMGDDEAAAADCQKLLELEPDHVDGRWLMAEIKKDPAKRFQGRDEQPPSASK